WILAISIFVISIIAFMTRCDRTGSGSLTYFSRIVGVICHDNPYLSLSQPQTFVAPPAESFSQYSSTSACVSQLTTNETDSLNLNSGPPFSAVKSRPSSSNSIVMTEPAGPGPALP